MTHTHIPSSTDEKRRVQHAIFKAFAAQKGGEVTEEDRQEALRKTDDTQLSVKALLAKDDSGTKIHSPRDYQTELFQKAKEENIIAVLDTGSGKTHIATMLLRHTLDQELERRAAGLPPKTAFFLVDSVNLVFQQANVLKCGLDQNVEGICGAMGAMLWQKSTWDKLFAGNMVIVCTAQVLLDCMMHSFVKMSQTSLLIFDEAHHAKNNHPYARIMKDYYVCEPVLSKRPRIFGMTASPVDANTDIKEAIQSLETLLYCKIATASDLTLLQNNITKPVEHVGQYSQLENYVETPFFQELKARYGDLKPFGKLFNDSKLYGSELGRWASDIYWSFAFSEEEAKKTEIRQERTFNKKNKTTIAELDKEISQLREAAEFVAKHDFGSPSLSVPDLSSKVLLLHQDWLELYYERTGDARCIVFVERRYTARLLNLIFQQISGPNLHCDILIGNNSSIGDQRTSLRTQFLTLAKFRRGDTNCLFATKVAEEGLDIPQCNLVVRFDLYRTMISYVQSRGRARHRNSKYLHMVEAGNPNHVALVRRAKQAERIMRDFCNSLPKDRIIDEVDDDMDQLFIADEKFPTHIIPSSGAKLTFRSSLSILAHFVASLPTNQSEEICLQPNYVVDRQPDGYLCEVILPECSPCISMRGVLQRKKAVARCSAAYEMCLELLRKGYLNDNLLPTYTKQVSAKNTITAVDSKKKDMYKMRVKPEFWDLGYGSVPELLYMTVIDVSAGLERPHQPLGLLTRQTLPQFPAFPIYLTNGKAIQVLSTPLRTPLATNAETTQLFNTVTLQIYFHIFAKKFENDISKMSYWLVPLHTNASASASSSNPRDLIDWEQITEINQNERYLWTSDMAHDFLKDRYFVDPHDGGRRFYSVAVRPGAKALDPVPDFAPSHKWTDSILDYSVSLWRKNRAAHMSQMDLSQPVVEVEKIPFRRNLLATVEDDEADVKTKATAYVCPQPMLISTLSTKFVAMCYIFPAIIHRFEAYLTALDACHLLGLRVSPALALEAVTKDSDITDEEGDDTPNFKSGMGPNYERLEFMGDCFLKMVTTISTFVLEPFENEGDLHERRKRMLTNSNLLRTALYYKLYEYVRTMAFSRRTWYPEGLKLIWGKGANRNGPQEIKHALGDKSIADVCEALIGAAFIEDNRNGHWDYSKWNQAVRAVKLLVDSEDHQMATFSDYYSAYVKPKYQTAEATASQIDLAAKVEKTNPYHFIHPRLLRSAFIHPSQAYIWEKIPNYQRLEFLGDSLLDQVFIMDIFYRFPDRGPQWLTEHKMPMVSNMFLGAVCVQLGWYKYIRHNHSGLTYQIQEYVEELHRVEQEARGKDDYWSYWTVVSNPPKCLADIVEAYVGAMFVDSAFDFSVVQNFYDLHLKKYFTNMSLYDDFAGNQPFNRLVRLFQENFGCSEMLVGSRDIESGTPGSTRRVICMVLIHYNVYFDSQGDSTRYAKPRACKKALEALEGLPPFEFRQKYGCDCNVNRENDITNGMGDLEINKADKNGE
ncbi:endoribonuclease dcr-1 [Aaosphaeria arxii CBS 175.79]|uniref:Dicer-like protein 1 n=1 Tax=Aaosphaeria arxii CBS 175.79 TaxID=1450172 RepID=A0A6A5Y3V9_9PLEO|nr:endoribonuclease dcr-1 [Aaosphaeria arxii CBS 175.79]KAF2019946.1 endoribonuclease dcr-1 [Aaosphaeria arxii CBS 175.79]